MKKILTVVLFATLVFAFGACASSAPATEPVAADQVEEVVEEVVEVDLGVEAEAAE